MKARSNPSKPPRKPRRAAASANAAKRTASRSAVTGPAASTSEPRGDHWTFLTNHTHVLIVLAQNPSVILREVALEVGITERAVQRIIADLEVVGAIEREKIGRQNRYRIRRNQPLRHRVSSHCTIGELLDVITDD